MARWGKPTLLALLVAIALIPMAAIIFAVGFFPYKPFLPGLAEHSGWNHESFPSPPFDKIIFMVVDALRSDFVYSHASGFRFTQQLISRGAAIPFTAHAASPTITMPRVKALTTGSVPSFLDVILNFAESDTTSTLAQQDTWLAQMKALKEGNMIMYGDDTWLKLFPETFDRTDGTSSFFVSDFTEVDYNVTRHVSHELRSTDWHTMIMHYLGLDHIGHKAGPRSPNMVPKQQEMDGIVRQIYEAIEGEDHLQSTLLVLCGDHGMNDAGNHGGSSEGETSSALVFVSPKFQQISRGSRCPIETPLDLRFYSVVEQSDITPTLAGLLGLPIPRNNLGVFIPSLLELWSRGEDKVHLLLSNARQILKLVQAGFPSMGFEGHGEVTECSEALSAPEALACQWTNIVRSMEDQAHTTDAIRRDQQESLLRFCHEAQHLMSQTASNYDTSKLTTGIMSAVVAVAMVSVMLQSVTKSLKIWAGLWLVPVTYGGMMFASSFVEEEQHFWYWSTSSWLIYLTANVTRSEARGSSFHALLALGALVGLRVTRRWNQTGQKFAGHRDIARHFLPSHTSVMWTMIAATYLYAMYRVSARSVRLGSSAVSLAASISLCFTALVFKAAFTSADAPELLGDFPHWTKNTLNYMSLIVQARVVFSGLALFTLRTLVSGRKNMRHVVVPILHDLLTIFLMTQSRVTNVPLFLIFTIQLYFLGLLQLSILEISVTSVLFQHVSFFALGGSNGISSIDLSNAYNGVSGYNVIGVGFLTFVSNWAGPIWWTSAAILLLLQKREAGHGRVLSSHLTLTTLFATTSLLSVMVACTSHRTHLFIWTVFSPKYLYSMAWGIAQHLGFNVVFGSILFWAGSS